MPLLPKIDRYILKVGDPGVRTPQIIVFFSGKKMAENAKKYINFAQGKNGQQKQKHYKKP